MEKTYGLGAEILSFAVANDFVKTMNKGCYELGKNLMPFCFYPNEIQDKYKVVDLSAFAGLVDVNKSLVNEIAEYRLSLYSAMGGYTNLGSYDKQLFNKTLFIDYLMSVSICYIETPKYVTKNGVSQKTFDKCLVTKNPRIMSAWTGASVGEMQGKYTTKVQTTPADLVRGELRAVKLLSSASKGNTISCPRGSFSTAEMTCVPLFMIYAWMQGCFPKLQDNIIQFTYLKDNGTIRELPATVSKSILMSYYNDENIVEGMLGGADIFSVEQGGMKLSSKQNRGYVRLPEVGSSKYDKSGVRALNLSRILKAEVVPEVDRSFIDVDINSVVQNFKDSVDWLVVNEPDKVKEVYTGLGVSSSNLGSKEFDLEKATPTTTSIELQKYVDTAVMILSTTFQKQLHLFMINNPQLFPKYTGTPNIAVESSENFGVASMDF